MFLLATDALSELETPGPDPGLLAWFESVDGLDLYRRVITVGETRKGIAELSPARKRRALEARFDLPPDRCYHRIIPSDDSSAVRLGQIQAQAGSLPSLDTLRAARAITKRLRLVAPDAGDMARTRAQRLDRWGS
jgi:predicted nucleic acid-binding protein